MSFHDWRADALCAEIDLEIFFPGKGGDGAREARAVCTLCQVRAECLQFALDVELDSYRYGIYGGLNPRERSELAAERSTA